jgi:hypothetical protein
VVDACENASHVVLSHKLEDKKENKKVVDKELLT